MTEELTEIMRILERHQAGIDDLRRDFDRYAPSPLAIETLVGLAQTALHDLGDVSRAKPAPVPDSEESRVLEFNDRILRSLEWQARRRVQSLDTHGSLSVTRAAAEWACFNHPGRFTSSTLENALAFAGRSLLQDATWTSPGESRVLHVMTVASGVGGHTRLADRWIRFDDTHRHGVILTEQGDEPVPSWLEAHASEGVRRLEGAKAAERVIELHREIAQYDFVVLHHHAYDVVAVAACADSEKRPPTVVLNHADHLFWLGTSAADLVVSLRPEAASLDIARRGVAQARSEVLPVPLDEPSRALENSEAKRRLALPPDSVVMLTVASEWKFALGFGQTFDELVLGVLQAVPNAHLVVVGPDPTRERWTALQEHGDGRIRVLNATPDVQTLLEAADVYLDSIPLGSMTSILEAAALQIPAVALAFPGAVDLGSTGFAGDSLLRFASPSDWHDGVVALLTQSSHRREASVAAHRAVEEHHLRQGWRPALTRVYQRAAALHHDATARFPATSAPIAFSPRDMALAKLQMIAGASRSVETLLAAHGLLPESLSGG